MYEHHRELFAGGGEEDEELIEGETPVEKARRLRNKAADDKNKRKIGWINFLLFDVAGGDQLRLEEASRQPIGLSLTVKALKMRRANEDAAAQGLR